MLLLILWARLLHYTQPHVWLIGPLVQFWSGHPVRNDSQLFLCLRPQIHHLYWHIYCVIRQKVDINLLIYAKEMQNPALYLKGLTPIISPLLRGCHNGVPPLHICLLIPSIDKFIQNYLNILHICFQFIVEIILPQTQQFFLQLHPILPHSSHINIVYSTAPKHSLIIKIMLEGVHNESRRDKTMCFGGGSEITAKKVGNFFMSVFLYQLNHWLKEPIPLLHSFRRLFGWMGLLENNQVFFALMPHKFVPQGLGIGLNVFRSEERNHNPYIIWNQDQVSMLLVGIEECHEEMVLLKIAFSIGSDPFLCQPSILIIDDRFISPTIFVVQFLYQCWCRGFDWGDLWASLQLLNFDELVLIFLHAMKKIFYILFCGFYR